MNNTKRQYLELWNRRGHLVRELETMGSLGRLEVDPFAFLERWQAARCGGGSFAGIDRGVMNDIERARMWHGVRHPRSYTIEDLREAAEHTLQASNRANKEPPWRP